jgi:hypothetical protein
MTNDAGTLPPAYSLYRKPARPSSGPLGLNKTIRRTGQLMTPSMAVGV